jgi:hypothetical protein
LNLGPCAIAIISLLLEPFRSCLLDVIDYIMAYHEL